MVGKFFLTMGLTADIIGVMEVIEMQEVMTNPKIVELQMTCGACPSQWQGKTDSGNHVFIHYRWGFLTVDIDGQRIYQKTIGDEMSGVLGTLEMKQLIGTVFEFDD